MMWYPSSLFIYIIFFGGGEVGVWGPFCRFSSVALVGRKINDRVIPYNCSCEGDFIDTIVCVT